MKRNHLQIITAVVIIATLWMVVRWTGLFQMYRIPNAGNEPTLQSGDWIYVSNLVEPQILDFVCFEDAKGNVTTYRFCAKEGDTIEMRDGTLYVNGDNRDQKLSLKHLYAVQYQDYEKLPSKWKGNEKLKLNDTTYLVFLPDHMRHTFTSANLFEGDPSGSYLHKDFPRGATLNNFGPLVVPEESIFVLGDNRNIAVDSRYVGFIQEENIIGTILNR